MAILIYLLKTTVVFVTLFSLYNVFLKNITFLRLRRWYLISTLFLSFLIPWVSTLLLPKYYHPEPGSVLAWIDEGIRRFAVTNWLTETWGHDLVNILTLSILGGGFILVSAKYIISLGSMYRFLKDSHLVSKSEQFTLRTGNKGEGSFCFLKTIYLCGPSLNEQNLNVILEHEKAHIRQKHYIDLWLSAMCDYFFWFNPFTKKFQAAWEEVLECLADREAIQALQIEPITYQSVLYSNVEYSSMLTALNQAFGRSMIAKRLLFISRKPISIKWVLPRLVVSFIVMAVITMALAFMDIQIFQLQKINEIRNAGFDLHEVTTGYVLDSSTEKPVSNAVVKGDDAVAVTDADGFFFIENSSSKLSVQHMAYNKKNTTVSDDLIILIEPTIQSMTTTPEQPGGITMIQTLFSPDVNDDEYAAQNLKLSKKSLIQIFSQGEMEIDDYVIKMRLQQGSYELDREVARLVNNAPQWSPVIQNTGVQSISADL